MSTELRQFSEMQYLKGLLRSFHILILAKDVDKTLSTVKVRLLSKISPGSITEYVIDMLPEIAEEFQVTTEKTIQENIPLILTETGDHPVFVSFANEPSLVINVLQAITAIQPEKEAAQRAHGAVVVIPAKLRETLPALTEEKAKRLIISSD